MKTPFAYWRASVLGAVDGFIFGGLCEIANRIHFEFQVREAARLAAEGGPIIDMAYILRWWVTPCFFLLVFAIVSLVVHWLRANRALSVTRLWQEIGFVAVSACVLPTLAYGWPRLTTACPRPRTRRFSCDATGPPPPRVMPGVRPPRAF